MVKYIDIADDIRSKIFDKKYTYGQKLPYEYVLCVAYHCNKETMKKALDILVKEGLIVRRRGAGTFVKDYDASSEDSTQLKQSGLGLTRKLKGKGELKLPISGYVHMMKAFERMVCEAVVTGNRDLAVTALNMNLLCQIDHDANIVIDELIEAHKDYLPQFKQS